MFIPKGTLGAHVRKVPPPLRYALHRTFASTSDTAVVVGTGIAGLSACQVLRKHFKNVVLVERDAVDDPAVDGRPRKGVAQSRHTHFLLSGGRAFLEELFPGFTERAVAAGALEVDVCRDMILCMKGQTKPRFPGPPDLLTMSASRPLYESLLRREVKSATHGGRLETLSRTVATGLLLDDGRVRGVRVSQEGGAETPVEADLVVDCSGRTSEVPKWLEAAGVPRPPELVVNSFLGYTSQMFEPHKDWSPEQWKGLLVGASPPDNPRGGVILAIEEGKWILTLGGAARDHPPTDREGMLAYMRSLARPEIYEHISRATPLGEAYAYRRTANQWRQWHKVAGLPAGLVFLGDSACSFNPIYGQGMTSAALSAKCLGSVLARGLHPASPEFQGAFLKEQAALLKSFWLFATGEDAKYPTTEGLQPSPLDRFMHKYVDGLLLSRTSTPESVASFYQVMHMVKPPQELFRPHMVANVLRYYLTEDRSAPAPASSP
eukprot:tig00000691_g3187.t1